MVKALAFLLLASTARSESLHLKGFSLVDPGSRRVLQQDLFIAGARVASKAEARNPRVIEGEGRYLMPALWDMKASLWGNDSAKNYDELMQEMGIAQSLRVQLFYGVAHVVAAYMGRDWVSREQKRAQALEFPAAELIYPDKALGAVGWKKWAAHGVSLSAEVEPLILDLKSKGVPLLHLLYGYPKNPIVPGLSRELLETALRSAKRHGLRTFVMVDNWQSAGDAVSLGADAIQAFPDREPPRALLNLMLKRHCYFSPKITAYFELARMLGNPEALADPFMRESVTAEVLDSFLDPAGLWDGWRPSYEKGLGMESAALRNLKRISDAGIPLLSGTDAGWIGGVFQGYATHSTQAYLEKGQIDPWVRLKSATTWPAEFLGRHVGFQEGDAADFVVFENNPVERAANLRKIAFLVRGGEFISRESLKLDLSRTRFRR